MIKIQNIPENFFIDLYLDEDEDDLPPMLRLEDDEEVKLEPEETIVRKKKTGTWLIILTPHKLFTSLPILLVQIKAGNNSYKIKKWNQTNNVFFVLAQ